VKYSFGENSKRMLTDRGSPLGVSLRAKCETERLDSEERSSAESDG
jgi:hypothetical protein